MTTTVDQQAHVASPAVVAVRPAGLKAMIHDGWIIARRNLVVLPRTPALFVFILVQPVMFVVLFNYVFGGAIGSALPTDMKYAQYLIPGVMLQAVVFAASSTSVGLAEDLQKGIVDRFRSLPITRSAVLLGRIVADTIRLVLVGVVLLAVGLLIGFRFEGGLARGALMLIVAVAFGFAICWIQANIGMAVPDAETAQSAGFIWLFPAVFISSTFTPVETMPGWLQAIARNNPITHMVNLLRALAQGEVPAGDTWSELALPPVLWIIGITAVAAPLAVARYRRV
ncbi:MAG: ABC transporter permease [Acidimicrobiaceae bacterium]|nr:ABC transporter permease [Acidimicrobiaceae bacterium]